MGEFIGFGWNNIRCFEPDDGPDHFYMHADYLSQPLADILERAREKWGADISVNDLAVAAEHINTQRIGHDRYCSSDYTNYLKISRLT